AHGAKERLLRQVSASSMADRKVKDASVGRERKADELCIDRRRTLPDDQEPERFFLPEHFHRVFKGLVISDNIDRTVPILPGSPRRLWDRQPALPLPDLLEQRTKLELHKDLGEPLVIGLAPS